MDRKTTPAISIILYIIGLIFVAVSAFMLILAIDYTKTYIESYDATFADMWSNSLQYIIKEFAPYLGIGIICLGMGFLYKEIRAAADAKATPVIQKIIEPAPPAEKQAEGSHPDYIRAMEKLEAGIRYLENDIDTTREILSIKIEEKEKRDAYRLRGLGKDVMAILGEAPDYKPIPLFRVAQTMAMPDIKFVE